MLLERAALVAENSVGIRRTLDAALDRRTQDVHDVHHAANHVLSVQIRAFTFVLHRQFPQRRVAAGVAGEHFPAGGERYAYVLSRQDRQNGCKPLHISNLLRPQMSEDFRVFDEPLGLDLNEHAVVAFMNQDVICVDGLGEARQCLRSTLLKIDQRLPVVARHPDGKIVESDDFDHAAAL